VEDSCKHSSKLSGSINFSEILEWLRNRRLLGVTELLVCKHVRVFTWLYDTGQRITTIQLDGVQYFISRMNPYSPELNYFLAYQYCRSIGLQLASFESKEKADSMTQYLLNAGK
jgi:hypothetical protein